MRLDDIYSDTTGDRGPGNPGKVIYPFLVADENPDYGDTSTSTEFNYLYFLDTSTGSFNLRRMTFEIF